MHSRYGPPENLQLREVAKPVPGDSQVLVRVHASSINAADYLMLRGLIPRGLGMGVVRPKDKILGADIAGVVESVGKNVLELKPGDEVFGDLADYGYGGYAEYVCADESLLVLKPPSISFEVAAAVPLAAVTAWRALHEKARVQQGQKVAVNGASGGVGSFTVMLASIVGAEVTAVCSTRNQEMIRQIGAAQVIDYSQTDFTAEDESYDIIVAANGYHPLEHYRRVLAPAGTYIVTGGKWRQLIQVMRKGRSLSRRGDQTFTSVSSKPDKQILQSISGLLQQGRLIPLIDKVFPLSETADAFRYVLDEHPQGKVIIRIAD